MTRCRTTIVAITAAAAIVFCNGCTHNTPEPPDTAFHCQSFDIWPDSIDLHSGIILRATSDSTLDVRVEGNTIRTVHTPQQATGSFSFRSEYPLIDILYRIENTATEASGYTLHTPYELYLNPINTESASRLLEEKVKNNHIIPIDLRRYSWPVINNNAIWLLAATELCKTTGDTQWLRKTRRIATAIADEEFQTSWNHANGLFCGTPWYLVFPTSQFPQWMEPTDIFQTMSLTTNASWCAAINALELLSEQSSDKINRLPITADQLRRNINARYWIPNAGYYSGVLYGTPLWPVQLQASDNIGQAIAILGDIATAPMATSVISKTPTTDMGIATFHPSWQPQLSKTNISSLLTQAFWTAAAARTGNATAYSAAAASLIAQASYRLINHPERKQPFLHPISSFIIRGLLGIRFDLDGIRLNPFVPEFFQGEKQISGLHYRKATLNIRINGTGQAISTFTIDGHPMPSPFIPADIEGIHDIAITLAGPSSDTGTVNIIENIPTLPAPPDVQSNYPQFKISVPTDEDTRSNNGNNKFSLYINGILTDELSSTDYILPDSCRRLKTIQFAAADEISGKYLTGFSSAPVFLPYSSAELSIDAASAAKGGTRLIKDKKAAERFVESSFGKNRDITIELHTEHSGNYLLDVSYCCGLGIVNQQYRIALRRIRINGAETTGTLVFPQLSPLRWSKELGDRWQYLTTYSNPTTVKLDKGLNKIELRFYQPSPVYVDPGHNTLLFDKIRLRSLD